MIMYAMTYAHWDAYDMNEKILEERVLLHSLQNIFNYPKECKFTTNLLNFGYVFSKYFRLYLMHVR